jgi:hypothetical protein
LEDFHMKSIALAAAFSLAATSAFAGSLAEPVVEAPVMAAEEGSSSAGSSGGGVLVPLLVILAIGAAVAASND